MDLNILMIGKTGHGKSATGNSILNRKEFVTSSSTQSVTKNVKDAYAKIGSLSIKVVDGPGLEDTDLTERENIITACQNMAKSLLLCNGGVHIFVLVLKFGERFTSEERETVTILKNIFGTNYLKERGIIILTRGDQFPIQMVEDRTPEKTLMMWCKDQEGDIKTLFEECDYRIVLFNNVTATEEEKQTQRNELLRVAHEITNERGMYTNEHFHQYAELRKKLIESRLTIFRESVQRMINLLTAGLGCLTEASLEEDIEQVEVQTNVLQQEIEARGVDESVLEIISILGDVQKTLQELKQGKNKKSVIGKLQKQKEKLEEGRQNKIPWKDIFIWLSITLGVAVSAPTGTTVLGIVLPVHLIVTTITAIVGKIWRRK